MRKQLLKFDDVTNDQRKIVFAQRRAFMNEEESQSELVRRDLLDTIVARGSPNAPWQSNGTCLHVRLFAQDLPIKAWAKEEGVAEEVLKTRIADVVRRMNNKRR